jgi:hypothetical protein
VAKAKLGGCKLWMEGIKIAAGAHVSAFNIDIYHLFIVFYFILLISMCVCIMQGTARWFFFFPILLMAVAWSNITFVTHYLPLCCHELVLDKWHFLSTSYYLRVSIYEPITLAGRFKACTAFFRLTTRIVGSHRTRCRMHVPVFLCLCCPV